MPFVIKKTELFQYETPQQMYQDNKAKKILGPLDYQSKMIDEYMKVKDKKSIALELPTGSGKTLIGLLIGEFRRQMNNERILFLCTTNQLVHQVVEQANEKYGIKALAFCGKQKDYNQMDWALFTTSKAIGVTTYSSFFACNSRFSDVDILIMDDVHSCEDYIASNWTVNITNDDNAFDLLVQLFKGVLSENDFTFLTTDTYGIDVMNWCNMIPMPLLIDKIHDINSVLHNYLKDNNKFAYTRIAENIKECNIFLKNKTIQIRPWIPPTMFSDSFINVKQRILMSATLGRSGELERITGIENIIKLPMIEQWDQKGLGRRLFVFPDLAMEENEVDKVIPVLQEYMKKSVYLVPTKKEENFISEQLSKKFKNIKIFKAKDIEINKKEFIGAENAAIILTNRFDGVDFPDDESRVLFLCDIPKFTNLQEQFLISKMSSAILYSERIKTRIIQAVGRCSRNASDYSVVCIFGNSIMNEFTKSDKINQYPAELRAEINFGIENSMAYCDVNQIIENVDAFIGHTKEWEEAEDYIIELRNKYIQENEIKDNCYQCLNQVAKYEVKFQMLLWKKDYQKSLDIVDEIISNLTAPSLKGYKCYWTYVKGCLSYYLYKQGLDEYKEISKNSFLSASQLNVNLRWMNTLLLHLFNDTNDTVEKDYFEDIIENIEFNFLSYHSLEALDKKINSISSKLKSLDGKKFESGHKELGELLGYISKKDDSSGAPDPYWIINPNVVIVSEDKIYMSNKKIPIKDVREAKSHEDWIKNNERTLARDAEIITVFISTSQSIEEEAKSLAKNIYYLYRDDFKEWANTGLATIRKIYQTFKESGDYNWRESVHNEFVKQGITPSHLIKLVKGKELSKL